MPKFKVGDIVIENDGYISLIMGIGDNGYDLSGRDLITHRIRLPIEYVDGESYRLLTPLEKALL